MRSAPHRTTMVTYSRGQSGMSGEKHENTSKVHARLWSTARDVVMLQVLPSGLYIPIGEKQNRLWWLYTDNVPYCPRLSRVKSKKNRKNATVLDNHIIVTQQRAGAQT